MYIIQSLNGKLMNNIAVLDFFLEHDVSLYVVFFFLVKTLIHLQAIPHIKHVGPA